MRYERSVSMILGCFDWLFACSQVLLWAYGVTCMPAGIGLANKFLNFKRSLMPRALKWTCERFLPLEAFWWRLAIAILTS